MKNNTIRDIENQTLDDYINRMRRNECITKTLIIFTVSSALFILSGFTIYIILTSM